MSNESTWLWVGILWIIGLCIFFLAIMSLNPAVGRELVIASMYGDQHDIKRTGETRVATGARFNPAKMAVAHRTLPFGTWLTLSRGRHVAVVVVNDRGPFVRGRQLDLTPTVNKMLHCYGRCKLNMEPWQPPLPRPKPDDTIAWGEE